MDTLLVVLVVMSVFGFAAMVAGIVYFKLQSESVEEMSREALDKARKNLEKFEKDAALLSEVHNSLAKRVLDLTSEIELLKTKVEMRNFGHK